VLSLLGLAGGATATVVATWLTPFLLGISSLLLGRSFYVLYVQGRGSRVSAMITWLSALLVIGFWTWRSL
jgi:hypothetical protein